MMINHLKNSTMKKLLLSMIVVMAACTSDVKTEQSTNENPKEKEHSATAVPLNNVNKWKADQATRQHVADMIQVVNDSTYAEATKREQLYTTLQTKIDTLVKQCRMQGADHDALHVWLEKVIKDMKELKEEDDYSANYAALKKDIMDFTNLFE
jgi:hypothetical protein